MTERRAPLPENQMGPAERLLEIYKLNPELMAHFASYALKETDWRDLKVACAGLMLVQTRHGEPVHDDDGSVAFHDDDYRVIGEAMVLHYERKSPRMLTPKAVLRVAELLETDGGAALNREAGFADPAGAKPPLGRWNKAATKWLSFRESNQPMRSATRLSTAWTHHYMISLSSATRTS